MRRRDIYRAELEQFFLMGFWGRKLKADLPSAALHEAAAAFEWGAESRCTSSQFPKVEGVFRAWKPDNVSWRAHTCRDGKHYEVNFPVSVYGERGAYEMAVRAIEEELKFEKSIRTICREGGDPSPLIIERDAARFLRRRRSGA